MKNRVLLFLKGFLMGICDLIPGISGGTIAFITGIYTRLINAIKSISPKLVYDLLKYATKGKGNLNELKEDIKRLDILFLLTLLLGIVSAILMGSRVIKFLLDNYFSYTLSFFVGLILASSKIIFDNIKNHNLKNIIFGIWGLMLGILLSFLVPATMTNPSLYYVFLGGFFAVNAMFLPGISGAFILLVMGLYDFMINILHNLLINVHYFSAFIIGALLGAFTISRAISFLFKKNKCKTLYFLLGLVIGTLSIPIKRILNTTPLQPLNISIMLFFISIGILLVVVVNAGRKDEQ